MSRTSNQLMKGTASALVAAAIMAPGAGAASDDLRSPDAQDAAVASQAASSQDLRSPDARDTGLAVSDPSPAPEPSSEPSGSDWTTPAIVSGTLVLVVIGTGGALLLGRRRNALRKSRMPVASS